VCVLSVMENGGSHFDKTSSIELAVTQKLTEHGLHVILLRARANTRSYDNERSVVMFHVCNRLCCYDNYINETGMDCMCGWD
jgi:hypothetical protein